MRDMPYIDALIAGFCTSCDEPNAAKQAIVFNASLEKSGWTIVSAAKIESNAKVIADLAAKCEVEFQARVEQAKEIAALREALFEIAQMPPLQMIMPGSASPKLFDAEQKIARAALLAAMSR